MFFSDETVAYFKLTVIWVEFELLRQWFLHNMQISINWWNISYVFYIKDLFDIIKNSLFKMYNNPMSPNLFIFLSFYKVYSLPNLWALIGYILHLMWQLFATMKKAFIFRVLRHNYIVTLTIWEWGIQIEE